MSRLLLLCGLIVSLSRCGDDAPPVNDDLGIQDASVSDESAPIDTSVQDVDTSVQDEGILDEGADDATTDVGILDEGTADESIVDEGTADEGILDGDMTDRDSTVITPSGDTCASAIPIELGESLTGTTVGLTNRYSAGPRDINCPRALITGPDIVYAFEAAESGPVAITVTPTDGAFDPFIHIRLDCADIMCVAGTRLSGPGVRESVTFEAASGTTYFIIIDGEGNGSENEGPFSLEVATP